MGDVVDIGGSPKNGDNAFMLCGCTDEGTPMMAVVIVGESPFIACMVCPECEEEVAIENGYVVGSHG